MRAHPCISSDPYQSRALLERGSHPLSAPLTCRASRRCARFVSGCVTIGIILPSFVLVSELVGGAQRAVVGNLISATFALGIPALAASAAVVHSWRRLYLLMMMLGCGYSALYL